MLVFFIFLFLSYFNHISLRKNSFFAKESFLPYIEGNLNFKNMDLEGIVKSYIGQTIAKQIAEKLNVEPAMAQGLVDKGVALLLGGMAQNADKDPAQAEGLFNAITKDHDGSVFGNIESLLSDPKVLNADKILQHVLGGNEATVESALAADTGVEKEQATGMMQMLAPLVMGALGQEQSEKNLETDHLTKMFQQEKEQIQKQKATNPLLAMLDQEGDGVADDLLKMGMSFLNRKS
jgi:hypothetical protein